MRSTPESARCSPNSSQPQPANRPPPAVAASSGVDATVIMAETHRLYPHRRPSPSAESHGAVCTHRPHSEKVLHQGYQAVQGRRPGLPAGLVVAGARWSSTVRCGLEFPGLTWRSEPWRTVVGAALPAAGLIRRRSRLCSGRGAASRRVTGFRVTSAFGVLLRVGWAQSVVQDGAPGAGCGSPPAHSGRLG